MWLTEGFQWIMDMLIIVNNVLLKRVYGNDALKKKVELFAHLTTRNDSHPFHWIWILDYQFLGHE